MTLSCCLLAAPLIGCTPDRYDEPLPVMLDRERGVTRRLHAAEQIGPIAAAPDPGQYRKALYRIAWADRDPIELRKHAMDRLIAHDAAAFRRAADRRITDVDAWPALHYLFEQARQRQWTSFTRTAVRSFARPSIRYEDVDRPEHALIAALHPDRDVTDVIYDVMIGLESRHAVSHQVAAWVVLHRLLNESALRARLDSAPPATAVVRDLQAAAKVLDVLPQRREQVLWLVRLRGVRDGALWRAAKRAVDKLDDAQRRGLALRHLPVLARANSDERFAGRLALIERIERRLVGRSHVTRTSRVPDDWRESFAAHREQLAWGDLLVIDAMQRVLRRSSARRALFEQAQRDHKDERSEHGGALVFDDNQWAVRPQAPDFRLLDRRFIASRELIRRMQTGLGHYHFHAQRFDNGAYAGPGPGDLQFVERFGAAALVLTFIDRNTLNADYYQPGGVAVDLGHVRGDAPATH